MHSLRNEKNSTWNLTRLLQSMSHLFFFQYLFNRLFKLVEVIKLPAVDVQYYKERFCRVKSDKNLYNLAVIIDALEEHKYNTLNVIERIKQREKIMAKIKKLNEMYNEKKKK